jgi:hypothetical protein
MCHIIIYVISYVLILYLNWMEMSVFEIIFTDEKVKHSVAAWSVISYEYITLNTVTYFASCSHIYSAFNRNKSVTQLEHPDH